jgi:exodeoxyribonuclease VII large subunit
VGHEPDVTIADFVADLRAATPSNAAELAVPDQNEIYGALLHDRIQLVQGMEHRLSQSRQRLERLAKSRAMTDPASYFKEKRLLLDYQSGRLTHGLERTVSAQRERLARLAAALDAMSPLKVLGRGYAIAQTENGAVLSSIGQTTIGEEISLRLSDGSLNCRVEGVKGKEGHHADESEAEF